MKYVVILLILTVVPVSCSFRRPHTPSYKWYVTGRILSARAGDYFDNVAVKDPSIIYYNSRYHLFYTAKSCLSKDNKSHYTTGCGYVSASTLEGLSCAERFSMDELAGCAIIAPQVFYFSPHQCWYLIAQTPVRKNDLHELVPVYMKNRCIEDREGWTRAKEIITGKSEEGFWIDFWVICDNQRAFLFYPDQQGSVYRLSCDLEAFPDGFRQATPQLAMHVDKGNELNPWRLFEAVHIYYVRDEDRYLALLEGAYNQASDHGKVDSRNRFIFGMTADSLDGEWKRIEKSDSQFLASADNLFSVNGHNAPYTQVSHPELIRSGYDQRLEIDDYNLTMVFQSFDGSEIPDTYDYNSLPWELLVMQNYEPEHNTSGSGIQYENWIVKETILGPGPPGSFDEIAVKDPSIVYYRGRYHMFYTSKATYGTRDSLPYLSKNGSGLGYVSAPTLEGLAEATRYDMGRITGSVVVAPQVFFFEPHQLWYIIAQTVVEGKPDIHPVYLTNPDIENVYGWSPARIIETGKSDNGFWIDFWVICDQEKAHLFYTDHMGTLYRFQCPLVEFPDGFRDEMEEAVLTVRGENSTGRWRLHEASHIYYVKEYGQYLNIMEAVYPHPTRKNYWDSRDRFIFGMIAEKLEGPWVRIEPKQNLFLGDPSNLYNPDGSRSLFDQVSHPELIRAGYNQNLEIDDYNLQMIFQAFDADTVDTDYDYNYLPWNLMLMQNYSGE